MIRNACVEDLDGLLDIENRSFTTDKITRRSFRYLLTQGNAATILEEQGKVIRGYSLLLFNDATSYARLYSLAVDPACQTVLGELRRRLAEELGKTGDASFVVPEISYDGWVLKSGL